MKEEVFTVSSRVKKQLTSVNDPELAGETKEIVVHINYEALVATKDARVKKVNETFDNLTTHTSRPAATDAAAYKRGVEDGKRANVDRILED